MKFTKWIILVFTAISLTAAPQATAPATGKAKVAAGAKTAATADKKTADAPSLVDINTASADALKALPGIGDKYSAAIIKGRPYVKKTQLTSKGILPDATYKKVEKLIVAKQ